MTGWYWVAKGTEPAAVIKAAGDCGAKIDGSTANHALVPPGFSTGVFHFVGENNASVQMHGETLTRCPPVDDIRPVNATIQRS